MAEYLRCDEVPSALFGVEKRRAEENINRLLSILELVYAKQQYTREEGGDVVVLGCRGCYYDRWMSITEWYFSRFRLKYFLNDLEWQEWDNICFQSFHEDCMKEYATFSISLVHFSIRKMNKLKEKLSIIPDYLSL